MEILTKLHLYLYLYIFLVVTSVHTHWDVMFRIRPEIILLGIILLIFTLTTVNEKGIILQRKNFLLHSSLCIFIALTPTLEYFCSPDHRMLKDIEEYKSFLGMLIISPLIIAYHKTLKEKERLLGITLLCFFSLGIIFIYRYLYLGETRDFDGRPLLKIPNGDPNFLCTYFVAMIPLCFYKIKNSKTMFSLSTYLNLLIFFIICSFLTQSRMGIISLFVIFAVMAFKERKSKTFTWWMPVLLLLISLVAGTLLRFRHMADKSNIDRLASWEMGLRLMMEYPWFGVGSNRSVDFFYNITGSQHFISEEMPIEVHNTFLKLLSELGAIGAIPFFILFFLGLKLSLNPLTHYGLYTFILLLAVFINGMSISLAYKPIFIFLITLSITLSSARNGDGEVA